MYQLRRPSASETAAFRNDYCEKSGCQIVRYSYVPRGFAYAMVMENRGELVAYGEVATHEDEHKLVQFFVPDRSDVDFGELAKQFLEETGAPWIEAQTNIPWMRTLVDQFGANPTVGPTLFENGPTTGLTNPGVLFRLRQNSDQLFEHKHEPEGDWVIELHGTIVATGGFLTHYNAPFADLYMEVRPDARRKGFGSYLLQELRKVCLAQGLTPAARCDHDNEASRMCLLRSGMAACGSLILARNTLG